VSETRAERALCIIIHCYAHIYVIAKWPVGVPGNEELRREMALYTVSLGVDCGYCHAASGWKDAGKPAMRTARAMGTLMKEFPKYFNFARASAFTCYTCHRGAVKGAR
jgi:hypothetical protein